VHGTTESKYVQDNVLVERRCCLRDTVAQQKNQKMGGSHAQSRRTPKRGEEKDRTERVETVQPVWFDNVSLKQIMAGAGLTHGGFYSYFE
jgi:hypothetical protein